MLDKNTFFENPAKVRNKATKVIAANQNFSELIHIVNIPNSMREITSLWTLLGDFKSLSVITHY